jgi:hypothetical protein
MGTVTIPKWESIIFEPFPYQTLIQHIQTTYFIWLVVLTMLKIWKSMGRIIPYIMENKKCLKPPTSYGFSLCLAANPLSRPADHMSTGVLYLVPTSGGPGQWPKMPKLDEVFISGHPSDRNIDRFPSWKLRIQGWPLWKPTRIGCNVPDPSAPGAKSQFWVVNAC